MNLLYSMPSRKASWQVGLKMVSKSRALSFLYCTRVSRQTNSYPDQYITRRYPGISPRPKAYVQSRILNLKTCEKLESCLFLLMIGKQCGNNVNKVSLFLLNITIFVSSFWAHFFLGHMVHAFICSLLVSLILIS